MKKILNVLLFAALYFVGFLAAAFIGFFHPFCYLFFGIFAAALCAWPYAKLSEKHPVPGMALTCVALMIIIYVVAGEVNAEKQFFVWGSLLLGLVAEAILAVAGHGSRKGIVLSYLPMSLIPFTLVQFMWASPTHMYDETVEEMGAEYADAMQPLFHGWLEAGMIALTLVIACFCVRFFVRERK